jgi:hypothetical protein
MPPELSKELDAWTEIIIDDWQEQKHAHDEDTCFNCEHGKEHHQHADACRFETCQCKCYE